MRLIHILRLRLRGLIHRSKVEEQPQKELRFHLERARPAALRRAGKVGLTEEHRGDFRRARWLEAIARDICFALRGLQRNPGFAALAILMLALGIGVNGAVFTVTNAILFKGFRLIDRNDRILYVHSEKNGRYSGVSYPDLQDWRAQSKSFAGMGAVAFQRVTLNDGNGFPETYSATRITANGFKVLGTQPIIGRDFTASDEIPGAAPVAILSFGFWQ